MINYHFVFCPRYRRKIFNIQGVETRFKEIAAAECEKIGVSIIAMECHIDHVHMFVNAPPSLSPSKIVQRIKVVSGRILRDEFSELSRMQNLWTRSYFVSTAGDVSSETIERYVNTQKTKYR